MGYRSNVQFAITGPYDAMLAEVVAFTLLRTNSKLATDECVFMREGGDMVIKFSAPDTKWYYTYEEVETLDAFFKHFKDKYCERENESSERDEINENAIYFSGAFVRVGEETGDIKEDIFGPEGHSYEQVSTGIESRYSYDAERSGFRPEEHVCSSA